MAIDVLPTLIVIDCRVGPAALELSKLMVLCDAPLRVTFWLGGENVIPLFVGVTVYVPSERLPKR